MAKPGGLDALIDRAKRISFDSPIADGASQDGDGFGVSTLLNHVQQVGAATINPDSFDSKIAS